MNILNKKTIVVVDDDLEVHDLVSAFFTPKDFEVICYDSAFVALEESLSKGNTWDVLLTDYHFPNMLVADFTKELNANLPYLPVILITPLELTETAISAISYGAYDYIAKPIHFGQLKVAVDRALKSKELIVDNTQLRELVKSLPRVLGSLIGRSPQFLNAIDIAKRVSKSTASILLSGESGTGKEVFANFIHDNSNRSGGQFVAINCASIPDNLLESELFGHAKGSFTGALEKRIGLFEAAENGTLFLDEIGDLSLPLQAKILRVLQEKEIKRVGENESRSVNCRIVSATHKNLAIEIEQGRFREDLYFRLNVIPISIPPLRDRPEDILLLAGAFLRRFALANESRATSFSKEAIAFLLDSQWPGNVRELENTVERSVVLSSGSEISLDNIIPLPSINSKSSASTLGRPSDDEAFSFGSPNQLLKLDEVINRYIAYAINRNGGAKDKTAKEIGIDRKTLYRRMQSLES